MVADTCTGAWRATVLSVLVSILFLAAAAAAQTGVDTTAWHGAVIAGQPSPWRNAHFVLLAYGAIVVGIILYLWRLASFAGRLKRDVQTLERMIEARDRGVGQGRARSDHP